MQSPVPFETSSSCGNSMPGSTANGILSSGNQTKTRSSVVCETRMERVELLVITVFPHMVSAETIHF